MQTLQQLAAAYLPSTTAAAMMLSATLLVGSPSLAEVYRLSPEDDWFRVLSGDHLRPGDEVILNPGVYRDARRLMIAHRGTSQRPIVIRSADHGRAVLHRPDARQNSINIEGAQYLVLHGLEITGGSTGIRMGKSSQHDCKFVTLENLHIHHVGGPAITANHPGNAYEGLVFRRNHIHHTSVHAEGFYLGVNNKADGSTAGYIFHCLIEGNYIHDLKGPNVKQGDGIEIKDGSYGNIVRHNVIHDTNYPGILVYGTDGKEPNIVEANAIWRTGDHGIQAAAEAILRNNIVVDSGADGIYSRAHQSARVGNLQILHNTVVLSRPRSAALRVICSGPQEPTGPVVIANNAFYVPDGGSALRLPSAAQRGKLVTLSGNVGSGIVESGSGLAETQWYAQGDLKRDLDSHQFPRPRSALLGRADPRFVVKRDFNYLPRRETLDAGAYVFDAGGNPGWTLAPTFKPLPQRSLRD
jgi:hypothetical protein